VSSGETDFNYDHHASFTPQSGMAVFDDWSGDRGMLAGSRPLDAPLLSEPTFPGCLIRSRAICMLLITDRKCPATRCCACEYWARIGHGSGLINFNGARFAAHEVTPDKARRVIALR
jgi:hypothetical protein